MGKKFYAIKEGFDFKKNEKVEDKIVDTWVECLKYVKGVKNAKYKSFTDMIQAKEFLNNKNNLISKLDGKYPNDCLHIYVDGSYNICTSQYSYGVVVVKENIVEYIDSGVGKNNPDNNIRQIAGELKGAIKGVEYALSCGEKKVVIFHDYAGICYHATGTWERKEESSKAYYKRMQELMNNGIEVIFVKVDSHTGDFFNELADEKCKEALGIKSDKVVEKWIKNNVVKVKNEELKSNIEGLISNYFDNIRIVNDKSNIDNFKNEDINMNEVNIIEDKNENIINEYKIDKVKGRKLISKLLSKQKEEMILYLLENKCNL
ncbi:ribonuclease HI [Clostridium botulinum]|uniref:ribonuclease H family protein n=1 Tax=Clostridium botulinum TaxID=1491 RepID=UPI00036C523F|nr:ribonuclease H family protein [Clostridium botulinum]MBN1034561.1 ribonuclease HI [Clostridium botulinum]MBN1063952.1 ribonuclease HI [Clostridium botulinum]